MAAAARGSWEPAARLMSGSRERRDRAAAVGCLPWKYRKDPAEAYCQVRDRAAHRARRR